MSQTKLSKTQQKELQYKQPLLLPLGILTITNGLICFALPYTQLPIFFEEVLGWDLPLGVTVALALVAGFIAAWTTFAANANLLVKLQRPSINKKNWKKALFTVSITGLSMYIVYSATGEWTSVLREVFDFSLDSLWPAVIAAVAGSLLAGFFIGRSLDAYDQLTVKISHHYKREKDRGAHQHLIYAGLLILAVTSTLTAGATGIVFYQDLPFYVPLLLTLLAVVSWLALNREAYTTFKQDWQRKEGAQAKTLLMCEYFDAALSYTLFIFHVVSEGGVPGHGALRETGQKLPAGLAALGTTSIETTADIPSMLEHKHKTDSKSEQGKTHTHRLNPTQKIFGIIFGLYNGTLKPSLPKRGERQSAMGKMLLSGLGLIAASAWGMTAASEFNSIIAWATTGVMVLIFLSALFTEGSVLSELSEDSYQLVTKPRDFLAAAILKRDTHEAAPSAEKGTAAAQGSNNPEP